MAARLDISGLPERVDASYMKRRYGQNFPRLLNPDRASILEDAIDDVYALFPGISDVWKHLDQALWISKTQLCYGLIVAWYIVDVYPKYAVGVASMGGMLLESKAIGGVKVKFAEDKGRSSKSGLSALRSNAFGNKAYLMLKGSSAVNAIR